MKIPAGILRLAAIVLMIFSLAACGLKETALDSGSTSEKAVTTPVRLKAFLMYSDEDRKTLHDKYYTVNVKKDLPELNVEFEVAEGTGYLDKLKIYNASGYMPDVYWGNNLPINSGNSLDLTDIISKDGFEARYTNKEALIPWKDSRIYAISAGTDPYYIPVVFYNRELFDKAGVTVPETIDQFVDTGRILKAHGYIPLTAPGLWMLCETFMQDLFVGIDAAYGSDIVKGRAKFSDPAGIKAFGELNEMIQAGMFPPNMATIGYSEGIRLFKDKKAAMCYVPTWEAGGFAADSNVDFFGLPGAGADTNKNINVWGSAQNGFSVYSHSLNIDAAVRLAEWFVTQDANYFVTVKKSKVSIDIGVDLKDVPVLTQKTFDRIAGAMESKTAVMALSGPTDSTFQTYMGKFLTGQITSVEFAKALDRSFAENDKE